MKTSQNVLSLIVIDEAHKIFDRMPSFRSAFDELKQLSCPLLVILATLTSAQVDKLQTHFVHGATVLLVFIRTT